VRKNSIGMLKGVQAYSTNPFGILEETHLSLEASWAKWVRDRYLYLFVLNSTFSLILMRTFLFNFTAYKVWGMFSKIICMHTRQKYPCPLCPLKICGHGHRGIFFFTRTCIRRMEKGDATGHKHGHVYKKSWS